MSGPFGSSQWMYASGGFYPYQIEQSLRFNDDDSAYLSRTPSSTGSRRTFTFSAWIKRSEIGTGISNRNSIFGSDDTNSPEKGMILKFQDDRLDFISSGGGVARVTSNALYRDASAWYHCVLSVDTTQATSSNRVKLYVNGEQLTSLLNTTYPSQNEDFNINTSSYTMRLGVEEDTSSLTNYFDGYMAEVNFIDGTALDPTSFGETKSGIWVPKAYTGTYGTNGFYLPFSDSAAIGDDLSGNGNDWTANNLVSTDVLLDSPTTNWCVLNPLQRGTSTTLSEGNLRFTSSQTYAVVLGSIGVISGKWYWEGLTTTSASAAHFGIGNPNTNTNTYLGLGIDFGYSSSGIIYGPNDTTTQSGLATYTTGDIIGVTMDMDAGEVKFYKNNSLIATVSSVNTSVPRFPALSDNSSANNPDLVANFGQDSSFAGNKTAQGNTDDNGVGDFYYAPPSGFLALCTANLPDPVIDPAQDDVPADYFNTVLYTGTGVAQSITVGFQPDFVWQKARGEIANHRLADSVRGVDKVLYSSSTAAEATVDGVVDSFDADGFTGGGGDVVGSGNPAVAWNWLAGNGTASNTDGSITSTVSVNQKAGFSVVSYTGNGTLGATVGHGLGAVPAMMVVKSRSAVSNWLVYHKAVASDPQTDYLTLETTNAVADNAGPWNDTAPTSSVFTIGDTGWTNTNTATYIAYCFAEVEGYSKFGSYTGNGSTDGPFVYTGFRPAFLMIKCSSNGGLGFAWFLYDTARNTYNVITEALTAESSGATYSDPVMYIDTLSNGFKVRGTAIGINVSGGTCIFAAFAESPFKYANAR